MRKIVMIACIMMGFLICKSQTNDSLKYGTIKVKKDSMIPTLDCQITILFNGVYKTSGQLKKSTFSTCTKLTVSDKKYSVYAYSYSAYGGGFDIFYKKIYGDKLDGMIKTSLPHIDVLFLSEIILQDDAGNLYYPCEKKSKLKLVS